MKKEQIAKKSLLLGVGLAAHAKSKMDKLVSELVKKGHINTKEGKQLVSKVAREAEMSGKRVAKVIETELKRVLRTVGVTPKKASKKKK